MIDNPMKSYCNIVITTFSRLSYSRTDAWKYHRNFSTEPEEFSREYADWLFSCHRGIAAVKVIVVKVACTVTREILKQLELFDMQTGTGTTPFWGSKIIARFEFTRDDYEGSLTKDKKGSDS